VVLNNHILEGHTMAKGKNIKKETKKPKKKKEKVSATANSLAGRPAPSIGGKK
tara:strand:+ start:128 stop:286 length:159 start_codon:yes stop_codon:yes gene_type:complete